MEGGVRFGTKGAMETLQHALGRKEMKRGGLQVPTCMRTISTNVMKKEP
jgi:hypothetical protein